MQFSLNRVDKLREGESITYNQIRILRLKPRGNYMGSYRAFAIEFLNGKNWEWKYSKIRKY